MCCKILTWCFGIRKYELPHLYDNEEEMSPNKSGGDMRLMFLCIKPIKTHIQLFTYLRIMFYIKQNQASECISFICICLSETLRQLFNICTLI